MPWVTGRVNAIARTAGVNSSTERTKPLKKTEARSTSSDSWIAWRSESETVAIEQTQPERCEQQHPDDRDDRRPIAQHRDMERRDEQGDAQTGDGTAEQPEGEDLADQSTSAGLTGAIRNSSMTPLGRSRTRDSAMSVTARCWRMSARTAGVRSTTIDARFGRRHVDDLRARRGRDDRGRDRRGAGWPAATA